MEKALEDAKQRIGGSAALAKAIGGISSQAISQWKRVPADRVLDVERATGVSRHELRPDLAAIFVPVATPSQAEERVA